MMKSRLFSLIWKEFLAVLRDRRIRVALFLPPVAQLLLYAFAATLDVKSISIGILNRDHGERGFELIERFRGASSLFTRVTPLESLEALEKFIDNQEGSAALFIDEPFSRQIDRGESPSVQLILDGRKSNTTQIIAGYIQRLIDQFNSDLSAHAVIEHNPPTLLLLRNWYNPNLTYYWFTIPSLVGTLSMLTCLIITSQSIARERELGTFDQLLVSPLRPIEILVGKTVPGIVIGTFQGFFMMTVGVLLFHVPFTGSLFLFFSSLVLFVLSISGVGLFISSLSRTQQQAMLGTFVFMMPSVLLSGFATPIENMPHWLQFFTCCIPLKYMLIISKGLFLKTMPFSLVLQNMWPIAIIAAFNLAGAHLFFKRGLS